MKFLKLAACITSASLLIACGGDSKSSDSSIQKLLNTNADIAYASYSDSVTTAKQLKTALTALKDDPTAETLAAAKKAWLVSREPYGQTEVYRFRNSPIDSLDVEGGINAWPLGEALIDYVKTNASDFGDDQVGVTANDVGINGNGAVTAAYAEANQTQNIIGNTNIVIDSDLLEKSLSAVDEHDVITGYHAIEFLLWGQDLNTNNQNTTDGTDRNLAINTTSAGGQRPLTDFTTDANASRRHQYLEVVVDKLIADLEAVATEWAPGATYRTQFTTITSDADANAKLAEILTGMGTLSEGELAGERMQIALSANSQEDEHSCFSDNTHRDIWLDAEGVSNSFTGTYGGYDSDLDGTDDAGTKVSGYGLDDYLASLNLEEKSETLATALAATEAGYKAIDLAARNGQPFDVLIMDNVRSATGPVAVTIKALNAQATIIQSIATELKLGTVVEEDASDCDTTDPLTEC
ncbi:MAG: peptidase, imelysin family protein [Oleispira sp.]|nr:peptidase, imelysin family protein [Oleispira sp.]